MDFTQRIQALVASNPGQMTVPEYGAIADELSRRGPCALLVFGLGRDTGLWLDVNRNGRTVFLEHSHFWVQTTRAAHPQAEIHEIRYTTEMRKTEEYKKREGLPLLLPSELREVRWDVILVDAPPGQSPACPGRFQSIYEASRLAAPDACVFVHDIDRPVEQWFSTRFLGKSIATVHRLGVFGTQAKIPRR